MPEDRLNMIKALIQKFTSTELGKAPHRAWAADFIENKGEGQIFLLHGSPGVGKTYVSIYYGSKMSQLTILRLDCRQVEYYAVQHGIQTNYSRMYRRVH